MKTPPFTLPDGRVVLAVEWFSGRDAIGVVVVQNTIGERKAYIGVGLGDFSDEETDVQHIADFGTRVDPKHFDYLAHIARGEV